MPEFIVHIRNAVGVTSTYRQDTGTLDHAVELSRHEHVRVHGGSHVDEVIFAQRRDRRAVYRLYCEREITIGDKVFTVERHGDTVRILLNDESWRLTPTEARDVGQSLLTAAYEAEWGGGCEW